MCCSLKPTTSLQQAKLYKGGNDTLHVCRSTRNPETKIFGRQAILGSVCIINNTREMHSIVGRV